MLLVETALTGCFHEPAPAAHSVSKSVALFLASTWPVVPPTGTPAPVGPVAPVGPAGPSMARSCQPSAVFTRTAYGPGIRHPPRTGRRAHGGSGWPVLAVPDDSRRPSAAPSWNPS